MAVVMNLPSALGRTSQQQQLSNIQTQRPRSHGQGHGDSITIPFTLQGMKAASKQTLVQLALRTRASTAHHSSLQHN